RLRGWGESSDAHHMSAPHPEGLGARLAMRDALARAGIGASDIGYLNLHGTATPANDAAESRAVAALFPDTLHASSTKGWTGHTVGAAGIVESVFGLLALAHGLLPGTLGSAWPGDGMPRDSMPRDGMPDEGMLDDGMPDEGMPDPANGP